MRTCSASGLNSLLTAIIRNTRFLEGAIAVLRQAEDISAAGRIASAYSAP
jgi:hypothetical protein